MRKLLIILLSQFFISCFSQDTIFYAPPRKVVNSFESCSYYQVIEESDLDKTVVVRKYTREGQQTAETNFKNRKGYESFKRHGKSRKWDMNGQLRKDVEFYKGKKSGDFLLYWANGQLKRKDIYEKGKFIEGAVWDSVGNSVEYYDFLIMPKYPGGEWALREFLKENLEYPEAARVQGLQGRTVLRFVVEKDGGISNIEVVKSAGLILDKEAFRVARLMPKWEPGCRDRELVRVSYRLPINFTIPAPVPKEKKRLASERPPLVY